MISCPKCNSVATNLIPYKQNPTSIQVYGCPSCGHAFDGSGKPIVRNAKQLAETLSVSAEGQKTLQKTFGIDKADPATRAMQTINIVEYGLTMWLEGFKMGNSLKTLEEVRNGETGSTEGNLI